jgi:hypothetical protein
MTIDDPLDARQNVALKIQMTRRRQSTIEKIDSSIYGEKGGG